MINTQILGIGFFGLFENVNAFLILMIFIGASIGLMAKSLAVTALNGFIVFIYVAQNTDLWIFNGLFYIFLTIIMVIMGGKVWSYRDKDSMGDV